LPSNAAGSSPTAGPQRTTAKQQAVLQVLRSSDRFRSAQQIYLQIRHDTPMRIGLTSVYRILRGLADDRVAETQRAEHGELLYRLSSTPEHRHYLLCRQCGRAVAFTPAALEGGAADLAQRSGFTEVTHHFDVYGICPQCRRAAGTLTTDTDTTTEQR
jgi:Fur family ferric uptake transcriptional regulator